MNMSRPKLMDIPTPVRLPTDEYTLRALGWERKKPEEAQDWPRHARCTTCGRCHRGMQPIAFAKTSVRDFWSIGSLEGAIWLHAQRCPNCLVIKPLKQREED
jgi:hypothetical protein